MGNQTSEILKALNQISSSSYNGDIYKRLLTRFDYNPPDAFEHGERYLVGEITAADDTDGATVEVYETRLPAVFWEIVIHPSVDYAGRPIPGFVVSTGSGSDMGLLMYKLAEEIAEGMVVINLQRKGE